MNRHRIRLTCPLVSALTAALVGLGSCSSEDGAAAQGPDGLAMTSADHRVATLIQQGKKLFEEPLPGGNGRACATCHVPGQQTSLSPAEVQARLAAAPADPLFDRKDADDPAAAVPTFEHLKKGLVRVVVPLPDNVDLIDEANQIVSPPDRKVSLWRGVPTVANTALAPPYQRDGRAATLLVQAQEDALAHAGVAGLSSGQLEAIASFEQSLFSSTRAALVAGLLRLGRPPAQIFTPEYHLPLYGAAARGRAIYRKACEACHGGSTTNRVIDRALHDMLFSELKPDGNVVFRVIPGVGPVPVRVPQPDNEYLNAGSGLISYLGQLGQFPAFNASVPLPRYRFRFYRDASRQERIADLPPLPVTASGQRFDPRPAVDENGAPIVGPAFFPQWFTTDPGRALITGNPVDFESFEVPQLRGIARTAPYFHDNSLGTLKEVIGYYSQFILPFFPSLGLPGIHPPEGPNGFRGGEALSPEQKADLLAYLNWL